MPINPASLSFQICGFPMGDWMTGVEVRPRCIHRERILPGLFDCDSLHVIARRSVSQGRCCTCSSAAQSRLQFRAVTVQDICTVPL